MSAKSDSARSWGLLLEFSVPRKEVRVDIVLLVRDAIVALEAKSGSVMAQAKRQVEEYALLLHYFHKASADRRIVPVIVSAGRFLNLIWQHWIVAMHSHKCLSYWVTPIVRSSWPGLAPSPSRDREASSRANISRSCGMSSPYFPVPSIIEAAMALRSGLSIREIAHSEASEHEIETVHRTIQAYVDRSRNDSSHAICFLTGVPGSGKTLGGFEPCPLGSEQIRRNTLHERQWPTCESASASLHQREYARWCNGCASSR